MKVIIKHGVVNYEGNRYGKGDKLNITEHFYNQHQQRFEKVVKKEIVKAKVIHNDEPPKTKTKEKEVVKASTTKTPNKSKSKKAN